MILGSSWYWWGWHDPEWVKALALWCAILSVCVLVTWVRGARS